MKHSVKKFIRYAKTNGLRDAAAVSLKRLSGTKTNDPFAQGTSSPTFSSILTPSKQDVIGFYGDIFGYEHGNAEDLATVNPDKNTIQWVIPNFGYGSGGHLNIFRFINTVDQRLQGRDAHAKHKRGKPGGDTDKKRNQPELKLAWAAP